MDSGTKAVDSHVMRKVNNAHRLLAKAQTLMPCLVFILFHLIFLSIVF